MSATTPGSAPNLWDRPGFADRGWAPARTVTGPAGELVAANIEPIAPVADLKPVAMKQMRPGRWVFDFGRIVAGWTALEVQGPRGGTVSMVASERVGDDGMVIPAAGLIDAQLQTDRYTLAGGRPEHWEPSFGYRGFRYVQLDGFPGTPTAATLTARIAHQRGRAYRQLHQRQPAADADRRCGDRDDPEQHARLPDRHADL